MLVFVENEHFFLFTVMGINSDQTAVIEVQALSRPELEKNISTTVNFVAYQ